MKHSAAFVILLAMAGAPVTTLACVGWCVPDAVPVSASCHHHGRGAGANVTDVDDTCARLLATSPFLTEDPQGITTEAAVLFVAGPIGAQTTAENYAHEAHAHKIMARVYIGNPNHPLDASMAAHCRELADLAVAKAERARTIAWVEEPAPAAPIIKVVGKTPSPSH